MALGRLHDAEAQGLSLARQFAMLSYRTPEEFGERFDAPPVLEAGGLRVVASRSHAGGETEDYLNRFEIADLVSAGSSATKSAARRRSCRNF